MIKSSFLNGNVALWLSSTTYKSTKTLCAIIVGLNCLTLSSSSYASEMAQTSEITEAGDVQLSFLKKCDRLFTAQNENSVTGKRVINTSGEGEQPSFVKRCDHLFEKKEAPHAITTFDSFFKNNADEQSKSTSAEQARIVRSADYVKPAPRGQSKFTAEPFTFHHNFDQNKYEKRFLRMLPENKTLIFFDTETTGLADLDCVIEIAFVKRNYQTMQETHWYAMINPQGRKSGPFAYDAHKIKDEDLIDEKKFEELVDDMMAFIGNDRLVAHNAQFDMRMLNGELKRIKRTLLPKDQFECTYERSKEIYGNGKGLNKLDTLCERYGVSLESRAACHGALIDTLLMSDMYPILRIDHYKMFKEEDL